MKIKIHLLLALAMATVTPAYSQEANQASQYMNKSYFLMPLSDPVSKISEEKSLCHISTTTPPLKLKIVQGLADTKLVSLESADFPGYFLRHQNSAIKLHPYPENDNLFAADATFRLVMNQDGSLSFISYNYPNQFISVTYSKKLFIAPDPAPAAKSFKPIP